MNEKPLNNLYVIKEPEIMVRLKQCKIWYN
jgi:hypothetical protein